VGHDDVDDLTVSRCPGTGDTASGPNRSGWGHALCHHLLP